VGPGAGRRQADPGGRTQANRGDGWWGRGAGRGEPSRRTWRQLRTEGAREGEGAVGGRDGVGRRRGLERFSCFGSAGGWGRCGCVTGGRSWRGSVMPPHRGARFRGGGWVPGLGPGASERGSPRTPRGGTRSRAPGERHERRRRRRQVSRAVSGAGRSTAKTYGPASARSSGCSRWCRSLSGGRADGAQHLLQGKAAARASSLSRPRRSVAIPCGSMYLVLLCIAFGAVEGVVCISTRT
jgi:hypothetical protein